MNLTINLKFHQQDIVDKLVKKYSLSNNENALIKLIKYSLEFENPDEIFGDERETCVGGCYNSEPVFSIEIDKKYFLKMKNIFDKYDFDEYDSEDEEVSKTIRCMINYADQIKDAKVIFA